MSALSFNSNLDSVLRLSKAEGKSRLLFNRIRSLSENLCFKTCHYGLCLAGNYIYLNASVNGNNLWQSLRSFKRSRKAPWDASLFNIDHREGGIR